MLCLKFLRSISTAKKIAFILKIRNWTRCIFILTLVMAGGRQLFAQGPLTSIEVFPSKTPTVKLGEQLTLTSQGRDASGNPVNMANPKWYDKDWNYLAGGNDFTFVACDFGNFEFKAYDTVARITTIVNISVIPSYGDELQEIFPSVSPSPRSGHSMVAVGDDIYLFGGENESGLAKSQSNAATNKPGEELSDAWKFLKAWNEWEQLQKEQEGVTRSKGVCLYDNRPSFMDVLYIFGKDENGNLTNDIMTADQIFNWVKIDVQGAAPEARRDHFAALLGD